MMTGKMPSSIGVFDNSAEFPTSVPTFCHYLRALGYTTALCGKMHFIGPDQQHGYERRLTTDIYPADFGWTVDWSCKPPVLSPSGLNMRSVVEAGPCERSLQVDYDDEVAFLANRELWTYARGEREHPFFLTVSFTHPHSPFTAPQRFWDLYQPADIDMPCVRLRPEAERDAHSRRLHTLYRQFEWKMTDDHIRNARHAYYGMVSYIDQRVGELLETLRASKLNENTIVIFTADHGEMLGERGLWYKSCFFESASRVPLLIALPSARSGRITQHTTSLVDLLPTLLEFAGQGDQLEPVSEIAGHSLVALLSRDQKEWVNEAYGEYTAEGSIAPVVMIKRDSRKFVYSDTDEPQLYDLAADPNELNNLAFRPDHATEISAWVKEVNQRWNFETYHAAVIDSQRRRLFMQRVRLQNIKSEPWDYTPPLDGTQQYVRSGGSPTAVKGRARFPYVQAVPPYRK